MFAVFAFVVVALVLLYDYVNKSTRVWKLLCQFPGPPTLPLVGNALELGLKPQDIQLNFERLWRKYGMKSFRMMIINEPIIFICEHSIAKKILSNPIMIDNPHHQIHILREFLGDSLIQSTGDKWRMMRKMLNPLFHPKMLEEHLKAANSQGVILMEKLRAHVDGPSFDVNSYLLNFSMDVLCNALLGINVNAQNGGEQEYATASRRILPVLIQRFYSPWYRNDFIFKRSALRRELEDTLKIMNSSLDKIIDYRRNEFKKNIIPNITSEQDIVKYISENRKKLTFIDILLLSKLPNGKPIPEDWIKEEANLLMFAGFDTTLQTIGFAVVHLAKYKELQQKVYEEQVAILGDDRSREPTLKELGDMVYLQRFVKESMRINPTVGQFGRQLVTDVTLEDGRILAAGTHVMFFLSCFHMNPKYFPNPEQFDPDRFLQPISPYLYMPFAAGNRICIGMNFAWMEVRSVLSKLVRNYKLSHAGPHDDPIPLRQGVMSSKNGYRIMLKERK